LLTYKFFAPLRTTVVDVKTISVENIITGTGGSWKTSGIDVRQVPAGMDIAVICCQAMPSDDSRQR
jgi:hypothetical protein